MLALAKALKIKKNREKWTGKADAAEPNKQDDDVVDTVVDEPKTAGEPGDPQEYCSGGAVKGYYEGGLIPHSIPRKPTTDNVTHNVSFNSKAEDGLPRDGDMVELARKLKKKRGY